MSIPHAPSPTPNVVIENPKIRRVLRVVLDSAALITVAVAAADLAAESWDVLEYTAPIGAALLVLRSGLGFLVDNPNTPKS